MGSLNRKQRKAEEAGGRVFGGWCGSMPVGRPGGSGSANGNAAVPTTQPPPAFLRVSLLPPLPVNPPPLVRLVHTFTRGVWAGACRGKLGHFARAVSRETTGFPQCYARSARNVGSA